MTSLVQQCSQSYVLYQLTSSFDTGMADGNEPTGPIAGALSVGTRGTVTSREVHTARLVSCYLLLLRELGSARLAILFQQTACRTLHVARGTSSCRRPCFRVRRYLRSVLPPVILPCCTYSGRTGDSSNTIGVVN
jgi:hypothetical protein